MSGPSLLALGKEWLPDIYPSDRQSVDCAFYNASITPMTTGLKWNDKGEIVDKGKRVFRWDASFFIRNQQTKIELHSDEGDKYLKRFKKKLKTLRKAIRSFIAESKKRTETPVEGHTELKREWLNDLNTTTPFTGHFFYMINPNGGGRFSIGDCHRAIVLWMEYNTYTSIDNEHNHGLKLLARHWDYLEAIAVQLDKAVGGIDTLNKRHRDGELINKLPNDSDEVVAQ